MPPAKSRFGISGPSFLKFEALRLSVRAAAIGDPRGFLETYLPPVIFIDFLAGSLYLFKILMKIDSTRMAVPPALLDVLKGAPDES